MGKGRMPMTPMIPMMRKGMMAIMTRMMMYKSEEATRGEAGEIGGYHGIGEGTIRKKQIDTYSSADFSLNGIIYIRSKTSCHGVDRESKNHCLSSIVCVEKERRVRCASLNYSSCTVDYDARSDSS